MSSRDHSQNQLEVIHNLKVIQLLQQHVHSFRAMTEKVSENQTYTLAKVVSFSGHNWMQM